MKTLSKLILTSTIVLSSFSANAGVGVDDVREAIKSTKALLMHVSGINGVGIGACERGTNKPALNTRDVKDSCMVLNFSSEAGMKNFNKVFPSTAKINGTVAMQRKVVGKIVPH